MLPKRLIISSTQNPRIKSTARLHDRKERRASGQMLVEGFHELSLALDSGLRLATLFHCPDLARDDEGGLLARIEAAGTEVVEVSPGVMERLAYREHPDAWLGLAPCPSTSLQDLGKILDKQPGRIPLLVLTENLEKPGNLGAILRSADAAGASGIIVCQGRTDVYNPNVVRSGKGSLFSLPVVECSNEEAHAWLSSRGFTILAATPEGDRQYWDMDFRKPVVIAVGAEKEGLSPFWMDQAQARVLIPMTGRVNSLNVAQAATLLLYEALRQRRSST